MQRGIQTSVFAEGLGSVIEARLSVDRPTRACDRKV